MYFTNCNETSMNALLLPLVARSPIETAPAATTNRLVADTLDFAGARIHLETDFGLVPAWYLGARPRRDAMVIALGRTSWEREGPRPHALQHARRLWEEGVSVLLVDVRGCEAWWARLLGRSLTRVMRGAVDYLDARGHEEEDCVVGGW
jgi:hypothetical protein